MAITRQSGETFDSVAARTHAAMEAIKSDFPGLASAVLFGDIKVADAYGVGGVAQPPGLGITSSTFRNTMTFTAGFCDTATDRQDVERFLDVFVRELPG